MRDDKISRTQLMALLWAGVMAPAAELLPAVLLPGTGRGAWLAVLLAAPLVLASGWLISSGPATGRSIKLPDVLKASSRPVLPPPGISAPQAVRLTSIRRDRSSPDVRRFITNHSRFIRLKSR